MFSSRKMEAKKMECSEKEHEYREKLIEKIEGYAGTLKGITHLDTRSLEKLYNAMLIDTDIFIKGE